MRACWFCSFSSAWIFWSNGLKKTRQHFHIEENVRLGLLIQNSPGERVRKLKAMFARGTMVSMQLSPLVSIKSWRVMAVGSMWCSLNGRIKACMTDQTPPKHKTDYLENNWRIIVCFGFLEDINSWMCYLSKDGQIHWPPRISPPVNKSWRKVCGEYSCH